MAKKKPTTSDTPTPHGLRSQLKKLDKPLLDLLAERFELAKQLGEVCSAEETLFDQLKGDDQRLAKLVAGLPKSLDAGHAEAVLREVLAGERNALSPLRVAYLGPENTYSHIAASHRFGETAELVPVGSIAAVFAEVDSGASARGVVPLENSTDGRVTDTLDCFSRSKVRICGELPLRIHHFLLGSGERAGVRQVVSKPQALSQCRNWLAQHLPQAEPRPVASTAEAAAMAKNDPKVAAIASEQAGIKLGLATLARHIEDQADNITRFAIIGPEPAPKSGNDKTALMFEAPHQPGALADAMGIFKRAGLNLTWIESFPIPGSRNSATSGGRYLFFVELEGHQQEAKVRRAIASLVKKATLLEVLGSYPQTPPID